MLSNALHRVLSVQTPVPGLRFYYINALSPQCNYLMQYYNVLCSAMKLDVCAPDWGLYDINALSPNKKCYLMHCTLQCTVFCSSSWVGVLLQQCTVTEMQLPNALYSVLQWSPMFAQPLVWGFTTSMQCHQIRNAIKCTTLFCYEACWQFLVRTHCINAMSPMIL